MPENAITERIIKCAIEVHRETWPWVAWKMFTKKRWIIEWNLMDLKVVRQLRCQYLWNIEVKPIGEYKLDMLINDLVIVEIKSVERFDPVFEAQVLTYLKITGKKSWFTH